MANDTTSELLTNLGLVGVSGASTVGSLAVNDFISKNQKALAKWDADTKKLWRTEAFKSPITGKWLQVSPEAADTLLDNYVTNAHRLSTQKAGPWRVGNLVGDIRLLPTTIKNIFSKDKVDIRGDRQHYRMFSDPNADLGKLKAHMLDVGRETDFLDGKRRWQMRDAYGKLSQESRNILEDSSSIKSKYDKLSRMADKAGLDYMEEFILGHGDAHPGTAKLVGGGVIGKIDPNTGKVSNEVVHSGFAKNYMHYTKKPLNILKNLNKVSAGAKGTAAAIGLFGLGNMLGRELSKSAAVKSASDSLDALGLTETTLGGGLTAANIDSLIEHIKQLRDDRKKAPNLNIGFNYGDLPEIGDGHKSPAKHIRQILERYIDALPEGHELKGELILGADGKPVLNEYGFAKRKGGVQFHDLAHKQNGITPAHAEDFNIIYNTGLGAAVPSQFHKPGEIGHKAYGYDNAVKLKGTAQALKHYVTDTPQPLGGSFLGMAVPNYGVAAAGPGLPVDFTVPLSGRSVTGHGYGFDTTLNSEVLGYGHIPKEIKMLSRRPLIAGRFVNLAPDITGTPFINPDTLDNMNKYNTRDQKIARFKEIIDNWDPNDTSGDKARLSKIYDALVNGKKVVTIAGSGRGDYVGNRTAHLLDSLDRLGADNVEVVPLMGGYTGAKDLSAADRRKLIDRLELADKTKGRVTAFGRLSNEPYTLLQQLSDINMASTGQMAISESANAGNLQFIPESWGDLTDAGAEKIKNYQTNAWKDIITDKGKLNSTANYDDIFKGSHPRLDAWNGGSMRSFPNTLPDVFKQIKNYEGELRPGAAEYLRNWGISDDTLKHHSQRLDTDPIAELLVDSNKGKLADLSRKAFEAASGNRAHIGSAQKALAENMVSTLKNNIKSQRLKALPGAIGNALGTGVGAVAMVDGIRRMTNPSNYKLNLSL